MDDAAGPSRRSVVLGAAAALAAPAGGAVAGEPGARAYSMAMHLHGSFSEGSGSMQAHLEQAASLGVDVVWWTDHDFRLQAAGYRTAVGLDALEEPDEPGGSPSWRWSEVREGDLARAATTFVGALAPDEAGRAMRLVARSGGGTATLLRQGEAWNSTCTRTLAATELVLDVLVEPAQRDDPPGSAVEGVVRVVSSYRPATGGRPAGTYVVEYRLGAASGHRLEGEGLLGVVGVPVVPGQRRRLALDLEADVATLWPDLVAADSGLFRLLVGARSYDGGSAAVVLDRLRVRRGRTDGGQPLALQREVMAAYATRFPGVVQRQGAEISLVRHLNAYGGDLTLPDHDDVVVPVKDTSERATREAVRALQRHGSVVALNHPLGDAGGVDGLADLLVRTRGLGADLVEVGLRRRTVGALRAFDAAARNAVWLTATGTSDDHDGTAWLERDQRWLTSVWAASTAEADLLAALRGGRAWFHDAASWTGTLDLALRPAGGGPVARMGQVLRSTARRVRVRVEAPGAPPGLALSLVRGRVDPTGRDRVPTSMRRLAVRPDTDGVAVLEVVARHSFFVRLEARTAGGALVAAGNPTWVLRERPAGGVPPVRRAR